MSGPGVPRVVAWCEGAYRRTLRVLPPGFRSEFGPDILATFRDACFDAHATGGTGRVLLRWLRYSCSLLMTGGRERARGLSGTTNTSTPRGGPRFRMFAHLRQDASVALRSFRRTPVFAVTAVGITALGIGATTTIFSVVDAVMLRPLPYPDPDAIVYVDNPAHSAPAYRDWLRTRSFSQWAAAWDRDLDLNGEGEPENLDGALVTPDFFSLFGARPLVGRLLIPGDYRGEPTVAVLSHGLWQRRFGSDAGVLGRRISVGGDVVTVVGVVDARFRPPESVVRTGTDIWLPLDVTRPDLQDEGNHVLNVVARLGAGVGMESAQAELTTLATRLVDAHPRRYRRSDGTSRAPILAPLHAVTVRDVDDALLMLLGAVGLLLLIACANVANLLLARSTNRMREMALRAAIGAGRPRLIAQLLTESLVLAALGGALGIALAYGGVTALESVLPAGGLPRADAIGVNLRVMGFAIVVALGTGLLFGVIPALRGTARDHAELLKESSTAVTAGRGGHRLRHGLVVAEIALALTLVTGAGLLLNSFVRLRSVDPGFRTEQLITLQLVFGDAYERDTRRLAAQRLLERVAAVPGVDDVSSGVLVPFMYYGTIRCCRSRSGVQADDGPALDEVTTYIHPVGPNYFRVLGARLTGRDLAPGDEALDPAPTVISRVLADQLYGSSDPLGRRFSFGPEEHVVVGIVDGFRQWGLDQDLATEIFVPYSRFLGGSTYLNLLVKTRRPLQDIRDPLQTAVWDVVPDLPVNAVYSMRQRIGESVGSARALTIILLTFGVVAVLLSGGGIYGSMLYMVGQRRRELGIRVALGAGTRDVTRMILRQGAALTVTGVVIGLTGAFALHTVLDAFLFGITSTDPPTLVGVTLLLGAAAISASYLPARRAARANPVEVLRSE